jgi:hypothetical protein
MKMVNVASSLAAAVGYDEGTRTLGIEHHDGSVYHYHPVSKETHQALMRSRSKGSFLHQHVRGKINHVQIK